MAYNQNDPLYKCECHECVDTPVYTDVDPDDLTDIEDNTDLEDNTIKLKYITKGRK